jgi:hypothetical protein
MRVLVTVPHSACQQDRPGPDGRRCDRRAREAAEYLSQALRLAQVDHLLITNDTVDRASLDLNRLPARPSAWRQQVTEQMQQGNFTWLLDIHSFPRDSFGPGLDLVLLDDSGTNNSKNVELARVLARTLGYNRVAILPGNRNDIQQEAVSRGIASVLIEFSEEAGDLSSQELRQAAEALAHFFKQKI